MNQNRAVELGFLLFVHSDSLCPIELDEQIQVDGIDLFLHPLTLLWVSGVRLSGRAAGSPGMSRA